MISYTKFYFNKNKNLKTRSIIEIILHNENINDVWNNVETLSKFQESMGAHIDNLNISLQD